MAVAEGLAALGHDVQALVTPGAGDARPTRVRWTAMTPPLALRYLRWMRLREVRRIAEAFRPDAVIERYYNFAGEGIGAARAVGATAVLEVNAPIVDHPVSTKAALDRALLVQPMRRWRERIVAASDLIVTPTAAILPAGTPARKIVELEWGADTDRFTPDAKGPLPFARPAGTLAVFAGAFRSWHGAIHLAHAIRELRARGRDDVAALFIGDGPELPRVRDAAAGLEHVVFTGAVAHDVMPVCLAAADVGVAPFDVAAHAPLSLAFYWSPLKIFEYMAVGLPVVAPALPRLQRLIEHDREGVLYDPQDPRGLDKALVALADPARRRRLGAAARERVVRDFSWDAHCRALDARLRQLVGK